MLSLISKSLRSKKNESYDSGFGLNTPSDLYRLSVVQALELGKDLLISLDKIGQLVKQPGALEARNVFPPSFAEGLPCRRNSNVSVFLRGYR